MSGFISVTYIVVGLLSWATMAGATRRLCCTFGFFPWLHHRDRDFVVMWPFMLLCACVFLAWGVLVITYEWAAGGE